MAAMPGMDESDDGGKSGKKPVDLAIIMGGKPKSGMDDSKDDSKPDDDALPHGFEEAFAEAFPDAAGDTEKMQALKRLIMLCDDDSAGY
jgi:hypothetical protein